MPNWKLHLFVASLFVAGTFACIKYLNLFSKTTIWSYIFLPIVFIYALLPDIDSEESIIRRAFELLLVCGFFGFAIFYFLTNEMYFVFYSVGCIIVYTLLIFLKHRGVVHTILTGLIFALPLVVLDKFLALICFIAFCSHLLIDGELKII